METPLRIPSPAPEFYIDAIPSADWFLQTSPELCMKRLLAAGFPRIYQISHCWRAAERGARHLPEFTMLEWYRTEADYWQLMSDCRELIREVAGSATILWNGHTVRLDTEWECITVKEAYLRYGGMSMEEALIRDCFDEIMVERIEPNLGLSVPAFLCDYPAERGSLARLKDDDPAVAERFELYIGGLELANGFSELTDSEEQHARFAAEEALRRSEGKPSYLLPEKYLADLSSLSASAGIALGIDRLVMILIDAGCIDDVVTFTPEEL